MTELAPDEDCHHWHPVPGDARHAFRGRRWDGRPNAQAVCGAAVPLAVVSEMDWVQVRTCGRCWDVLTSEVVEDFGPHRASAHDRRLALAEAHKLSRKPASAEDHRHSQRE